MSRRSDSRRSQEELERRLLDLAWGDEPIRRERVLDAIEALRRLALGQYGVCADCDRRIPRTRLEARPEATLCFDCQLRRDEHLAA